MRNLKITTAQFEVKSGNKEYNISMIETLCKEAAKEKSQVIVFPECSITGYSFLRKLDKKSLEDIAENLPDGESIKSLIEISKKTNIIILSGLIEKDKNGKIFNTYVCIGQNGLITYCPIPMPLGARHDRPIQLPAHAPALTPERSQQAHPSHLWAIPLWDRPWDLCEDRKNAAKAAALAHWFHPR